MQNTFESPTTAEDWIRSVEDKKYDAFVRKDFSERIQKWLGLLSDGPIVELGCGTGVAASLVASGSKYYGVDSSQHLLDYAVQKNAAANRVFIRGDVQALPLSDKTAAGVFSVNTWLQIPNLVLAARELYRILQPKGRFLIVSTNPDFFPYLKYFLKNYVETKNSCRGDYRATDNLLVRDMVFYKHSLDALMTSFHQAGLKLEGVPIYYSNVPFAGKNVPYNVEMSGYKLG